MKHDARPPARQPRIASVFWTKTDPQRDHLSSAAQELAALWAEDPLARDPAGGRSGDSEALAPDFEVLLDDQPGLIVDEFKSIEERIAHQGRRLDREIAALVRLASILMAHPSTGGPVAPAESVSVAANPPPLGLPAPEFMKVDEYATRVGYSPRTIANFIREGLPTVGRRRLLRIDVEAADEWIRTLRARRQEARDSIAQEAREAARRPSRPRRRT